MSYHLRHKAPTLSISLLIYVLAMRVFSVTSTSFEVIPPNSNSHLVQSDALPWAQGVTPIGPSYAGLTTVRETADYRAELFYWFFPCPTNPQAPLVMYIFFFFFFSSENLQIYSFPIIKPTRL